MAELLRQDQELVVSLSVVEKAEAAHGDIRVPLSSVQSAEVVDDAVHAINAWKKIIGSAWPGRFIIGTFRDQGRGIFAVVHHNTPRGVLVKLQGADFDEILVGCDDPENVARQFQDAGRQPPGTASWDPVPPAESAGTDL